MRLPVSKKHIPFLATLGVCVLLYAAAAMRYANFFTPGVFINFFVDNSFLGITAIGMTFVILSGGIDLSVGAMIGCSSIAIASLVMKAHMHPALAIALVLAAGVALGATMGLIISLFRLPPFLVTLAGMFFARGVGFVISLESISIDHPFYSKLGGLSFPPEAVLKHFPALQQANVSVPLTALVFLAVVAVGFFLAHYTRFGRNIYAIGGNEDAATLMGLPVTKTKVGVYAMGGFCSALAGVVYTLYNSSGYASAATGLELDAIAAVVIGGTLLTGGVGYVLGTLVGVLIFGIIQTAIMFQGTLSSWWTKIAIGMLLLCFILLQKLLSRISLGRPASE